MPKFFTIKNIIYFLLFVALLVDISFSFRQHTRIGLDGDMALIIVPSTSYKKVLDDPLGFSVLTKKESYPATNRFFAHWFMAKYFKSVPFFFQNFTTPINSVFLSCALAKTIIQVLIILLLAYCITSRSDTLVKDFLLAAALLTPLFQTEGYNRVIGIIDWSTTYTFFYALPLAFTILFFIPFYNAYFLQKKNTFSITKHIWLIFLTFFISFNGPLIPGVILVLCPMVLMYYWLKAYKENANYSFIKQVCKSILSIPKPLFFNFTFVSVLSLYSLYLGSYNSENSTFNLPLAERYARLASGIKNLFTEGIAFSLIISMIVLNTIIIVWKFRNEQDAKKILSVIKWLSAFSLVYIYLLPLGGTRVYRPDIIRFDTLMPITLGVFFTFGISTLFIIKKSLRVYKFTYMVIVFVFLFHYMDEDNSLFHNNKNEREAMEKIAQSPENIVEIRSDVTVLSWEKITDYHQSELNSTLMQYWGITKEKKLYYQK